jgi:putative redox protein
MSRPVSSFLGETDFQATQTNGVHSWIMDEPADKGGKDTAPTPTESVLGALGACIAITAKLYARHKGWDLKEISVDLTIEGNEPGGKPIIYKKVTLEGALDDAQRHRIQQVASKCPVARLLKGEVVIMD